MHACMERATGARDDACMSDATIKQSNISKMNIVPLEGIVKRLLSLQPSKLCEDRAANRRAVMPSSTTYNSKVILHIPILRLLRSELVT